jgi:hypothetical protein
MRTNVQKNRNEQKMAGNQASTAGQAKDEKGTMGAAGRLFPGYLGRFRVTSGKNARGLPWTLMPPRRPGTLQFTSSSSVYLQKSIQSNLNY